jgi:beta-lactamase regulating signal transducer with metallopeptidase domain
MQTALSQLGVGVLLAWIALPLFAWLIRPRSRPDARTLHRAQLAALLSAVGLLFVPWLPGVEAWLAPNGPYYQFEMRAVFAPVPRNHRFEPREAAAVLSPLALVGMAWLVAVAYALIRATLGARNVARLLRSTTSAPDALVELVGTRAAALGMRAPALRVSDRSAIPFAVGLWRPSIVLPRELVDTLESESLALVIEHELEHVRRGDVRDAAAVTLLKILLGGHPTAETLGREAVLAREIAVDARVSKASPREYATLLVDIAAHAHFGEKPAPTAIDDTALARRIALISEPGATRALSLLPLLAAAAALVLCTLLARTFVSWSSDPPTFVRHAMPGAQPLMFRARTGFGVGPSLQPGPPTLVPPPGLRAGVPGHAAFGGPPPEPVLPEVLRASPAVQACYAHAKKADPSLEPHVMFAIDVNAAGVATVSVMAPSAPDLAACLQRAVNSLLPKLELPPHASFGIGLDFDASPSP